MLAVGGVTALRFQARLLAWPPRMYQLDPAPLFYFAGAVGLALRTFWARYLAICFASAIMAIAFLWSPDRFGVFATGFAMIALLSGKTMRAMFDERALRSTHWVADLDVRVHLLRYLFVWQAVALALLFAGRTKLSLVAGPTIVIAGLALAGLVFQRTWAVLLMTPALLLDVYLAATNIRSLNDLGAQLPWGFPYLLFLSCWVSFVVLAPLLKAFIQRLLRD